ncbi:MAG: hypothetical protein RR440_00290 [Erysipelotrichaceae bacterium]
MKHYQGAVTEIYDGRVREGLMLLTKANEKEIKSIEKDSEDRLYLAWVVHLPHMNSENFISFNDYKNNIVNPNSKQIKTSDKTDEEIMAEANDIIKMTKNGGSNKSSLQ